MTSHLSPRLAEARITLARKYARPCPEGPEFRCEVHGYGFRGHCWVCRCVEVDSVLRGEAPEGSTFARAWAAWLRGEQANAYRLIQGGRPRSVTP